MFENKWDVKQEKEFLKYFSSLAISEDHAKRTYSSRLIGAEKGLVMHGGGNTSCKTIYTDIFDNKVDVLCVKGSGWDLSTIEPAGLPAVRLQPLLELRVLEKLSDSEMVNFQRANLINSSSPNPSIETLLHAFLPAKFIDHTHATPFLTLANLPNAQKIMQEIFGKTMAYVPYVMPGFELAKKAVEIFEQNDGVEGLLLGQHGHFTWGDTAKESYDRVIEHTNKVEDWLSHRRKPITYLAKKLDKKNVNNFLLTLRGLLKTEVNQNTTLPVLKLIGDTKTLAFFEHDDVLKNASTGVATPDHVIRIKAKPLFLSRKVIFEGKDALTKHVNSYQRNYIDYFESFSKTSTESKKMLSPLPKVIWAQGVGLIGVGATAIESEVITEIGEQNIKVMSDGLNSGGFKPITPELLFDMEYWSLEQAKISKKVYKDFYGKVVVITGGAGKIGSAIAEEFFNLGAEVVILDFDDVALKRAKEFFNPRVSLYNVDLRDGAAIRKVLDKIILKYGGLDILISNAGIAPKGSMIDVGDRKLRDSFELKFFSHYTLACAFSEVFKKQGSEGQLLFNISKQAINPGRNFGAYGLPKAALMALVRQLALEFGEFGIRVNGINADRIKSGLLNQKMIEERADVRNVSIKDYLCGNLLGKEVEAFHVAKAFVALANSTRTTGHVLTVDGGNIEATLR